MFKSSLSPLKIFAGAGAVLLVLLLTLVPAFKSFNDLGNANYWNVHSYQVLLSTSQIMRGLTNIQSASRGFLLTGNEDLLDPLYAGRKEFSEHYTRALELTRDDSMQQKRFKLLKRQYDIWMNGHINPLIKMRRATASDITALRRAEVGAAKRQVIMNTLRKSVASIEEKERDFLVRRSQEQARQLNLTKVILLYNGIFALALTVGLSVFVATSAHKMELLNRRLKEQMERSKKAEREADVFNKHNQMLLEAVSEGIAGVNRSGRTTFFNPAAELITGYKEEEVLGKPQHTLLRGKRVDGSPYPVSESPITGTLLEGRVYHGTNEVIWHKNGYPVPIEFTSSPLMVSEGEDEEPKQVGAVIVFRDITERRRSEAALQELASIITFADDAIISFRLDGVVTNWNRAATALYGYTANEMLGHYVDVLLPQDRRDELPALVEKIKRDEPIERYQTTRVGKDGKEIPVVLSLAPIKNIYDQITGVSSISRETFASRQKRLAATGKAVDVNDAQL